MPRPCKCRRICSVPRITRFDAAGEPHSEPVTIGLDELEDVYKRQLKAYNTGTIPKFF